MQKDEEILLNSLVFPRINLGIYVVTLIRSYLSQQEIWPNFRFKSSCTNTIDSNSNFPQHFTKMMDENSSRSSSNTTSPEKSYRESIEEAWRRNIERNTKKVSNHSTLEFQRQLQKAYKTKEEKHD